MTLRTAGLTKRFGGLVAVDGVDFELEPDECCSLIGPNGAGKTTFFNLLTGALSPTEGTVEFRAGAAGGSGAGGGADGDDAGVAADDADDGWRDLTDAATHETALAGIHRSYQISNLFPTSTVLENVRIAAQAHGDDSWKLWRNADALTDYTEEAYRILDRVGLADAADTPAQALSHGGKRNLEVAIALAGDPDVLLLDEPTSGVSTDGIEDVIAVIDDVADDHAILLVEHNMDVVMEVSDRIAVLHQGSLIADGEPAAVREDPAVQEAYLGGYEGGETGETDGGESEGTPENGGPPGGTA
ncbi:ABC transporter ATP-binding protein [Haloparvum alkalitolerans]|uniref:ABC transporter ATP-binding protein n=1 Tax=Haloparvum alkalitolerans TaxID=1042953 RepID=UPI003CFA8638